MDRRVAKALRPQQTAGAQPVSGYVPPLGDTVVPVAVYDNKQGLWVGLPLQALVDALLVAEEKDVEDILDSRNAITLSMTSGDAVGVIQTQAYTIPSGGAWWISQLELVTPASVKGNITISRFPQSSGSAKSLLATNQAESTDTKYDLTSVDYLGTPLRLVPGDVITVVGTVTTALTAAATLTLTPYGHVANQLV